MRQFHHQRKKEPLLTSLGRCTISCYCCGAVLLVWVLGNGGRRLLGVFASGSSFRFCNIFFVWAVYFVIVRQAIPFFIDAVFNGEVAMLFIGSSSLLKRVRYCKICKAYVKRFDHHCPAFGNCIGQNNHVLFMVLLLGFLSTEASYVMCSFQYWSGWKFGYQYIAIHSSPSTMAGGVYGMAYILYVL
ncbi:hypothetical protein GH714_012575 [Hevea brasiliensis]|uniref:S-acyltransferase n=1 Tax=Hevea brasiliensis TaxID=3981 RepID=A0A6A6LJC5_HEVBR|nr:hypothetical protein GH714_012575 [Hevea brasiliensis]